MCVKLHNAAITKQVLITQDNKDWKVKYMPQGNINNMLLKTCLLLAVVISATSGVDYAAKQVFDPRFYINTHGDLHVFTTVDAAKHHWLTIGINEGRQGAGNFHSRQYLKRYPDLAKAYGTNYHAAIEHYLENGIKEKRLGYLEGGDGNRYTISNGKDLFLSSSRRTAGAIDSLVWNYKEFLNAWDHGRELQVAVNAPPNGECYNPTEAGGAGDGTGYSSKSRLQTIRVSGKEMKTSVLPAFWIRHNDIEHGKSGTICHHGAHAINKVDTYEHIFSKEVTIGCAGIDTCITFTSHFEIAGQWPKYEFLNFEAPTGYLGGDFTVIKNFNPANSQIEPHTSNNLPPVMMTADNRYAMGVFAPPGQDTDYTVYYATWKFGGNVASKTNKWNVVFRKNHFDDNSSHSLTYIAYICVGTPNMVSNCLREVIKSSTDL